MNEIKKHIILNKIAVSSAVPALHKTVIPNVVPVNKTVIPSAVEGSRGYGKIFLVCLGIFLSSLNIFAQSHVATAKIDSTNVQIGDHIPFTISLQTDAKNLVVFPVLSDTMDAKIEFISVGKTDTISDPKSQLQTYAKTFTLTIFEPGMYTLPSIPFFVKTPNDTGFVEVWTNPVNVTVGAPEVNLDEEIKDIQNIWEVSRMELFWEGVNEFFRKNWLYLVIVAGLGIFTGVGIYLYRKWKNKEPLFVFAPKPIAPPHTEALENLEKLRLKQLWQNNLIKEFYTELTDILRIYVSKSMNINAIEMTSDELIDAIDEATLNDKEEVLTLLRNLLPTADLVKFAKSSPWVDEHDRCFKNVKQFIELTMPKEEEKKS